MLELEPWCEVVDDENPRGCKLPATDVDHVAGLDVIFDEGRDPYDPGELQTLCHSHHSKKTVEETGTSIHLQQQGRGDYTRSPSTLPPCSSEPETKSSSSGPATYKGSRPTRRPRQDPAT